MKPLTLKSPAKINLYLDVIRKRSDGYHDIYTIFERINLFDTIRFSKRSRGNITVSSSGNRIPQNGANIAYQAAQLLKEHFSISDGIRIHIQKRIPVAAGLGGGSSNAACVFEGLNRFWRLGLTQKRIQRLAERIGSDVPFFTLKSSFALGKGRGEQLKKISKLNPLWHILIVPKIALSAKAIYTALDRKKSPKKGKATKMLTKSRKSANMLTYALRKHNLTLAHKYVMNTLEEPAARLCPSISKIKETMACHGVKTYALSGSGPAVFGLVNSRKEAEALKSKIQRTHKSWQVFAVRTY
ncbi:4-(cytidine 5'-diphospho)-2-C-methyl-D-erythritol kinase [Candidatus Omnitrophota bacterium]